MTTPPALIDLMARAFHESTRTDAVSLPPWEKSLPRWQDATRRDMAAAVRAAEAAGWTFVSQELTS